MHLRSILLVLTLSLAGCGGAPVAQVSSPFTAADATVFDQGADFIDNPDILEGHWSDDWTRDLHHRMGAADLVETVRVVSSHVATQPDEPATYHLNIAADTALLGTLTPVDLHSSTGDAGYPSVESNQRQLLAAPSLLLFVKWTRASDGTLEPHWHLSPASEKILGLVRELAQRRTNGPAGQGADQPTIISHTTSN